MKLFIASSGGNRQDVIERLKKFLDLEGACYLDDHYDNASVSAEEYDVDFQWDDKEGIAYLADLFD